MTNIQIIGRRDMTSQKNGKKYTTLFGTYKNDKTDGLCAFSTFGLTDSLGKYQIGKSYDVVMVFDGNTVKIYD